jgi:tetratricopeptide (TPR) repeat protein
MSGSDSSESMRPRGNYAAILKVYAYQQSFDPASFRLAFEALSEARKSDERCGLVCSMLSLLYLDNLALEFVDRSRTPLAEARRLALEGIQNAPDNSMSRLVLARVHLAEDELEAGLEAVEAAQALHPDSILYLDVIGYLRVLLGDWVHGERLLRQAIELNPLYTVVTRYATWLCALRRGDHEAALAESRWLSGVGHFWAPLTRAVSLGLLGRRQASRAAVKELLELKPDFPVRGRLLIGHLVKAPELRRSIARGLAAGGLALEAEAA